MPERDAQENPQERTREGLPVVIHSTFVEFLSNSSISDEQRAMLTDKIRQENPQIYYFLRMALLQAPTPEARKYFEYGIQACYRLLQMQSEALRKSKSMR